MHFMHDAGFFVHDQSIDWLALANSNRIGLNSPLKGKQIGI